MERHRYVLSSTHLDSHGHIMTKEALEDMSNQLNGSRKPRLGLEHVRVFPPFGVIMNGAVVQDRNSEHFLLEADMVYFDKREIIVLDDGTELLKESFSESNFPFIECDGNLHEQVEVQIDPTSFEHPSKVEEIFDLARDYSGLEFDGGFHLRKSVISDPETIITITNTVAITLGIVKTKIAEKLGEAIGEDLSNFYKMITSLATNTLKDAINSNTPQNFVIQYPNSDCIIELVVRTSKVDDVLNSMKEVKLRTVQEKVSQLMNLSPEKIQFTFNNGNWEFNYLLTSDGAVIGQLQSFKKRNETYNELLRIQNQSDN